MLSLKDKHIVFSWNLLFFIALAVFWRFFYVNHLLQKEQMQLFLFTFDYFEKHLSVQGGFALYLEKFITQFFLYKWVATFLIAILLSLFSIGIQKVLTNLSENGVYILSWIPAVGYHFLLFNQYYNVAGLIAVLLSTWSVILYLKSKNPRQRMIVGFALLALNYWLLGGASILFILTVISAETLFKLKKDSNRAILKPFWIVIIGYLMVAVLIPILSRYFLVMDHLLSAYFSRAFYKFSFLLPPSIILILCSLPMLVLFYEWVPKVQTKISNGIFGVVLFSVFAFGSTQFPDFAEENEMRFDNLVNQQKWDAIISEAEQNVPTGAQGRLALSLALAQTGQMSTLLFHFNPHPYDFFIPFDIRGQAPMIANEPYFYLGLTNFSKMFCAETMESTPDESIPVRVIQRFAEDCIIDGQYDVAERYLWYLEQTLFYRKWTKEARLFIADSVSKPKPLWTKLRLQRVHDDFYYQYERNDAALISLLRSDPQNQTAFEYLMSWYLLRKDFDEFLKFLPLVNSMKYKSVPKVFQEAVAYIKTLYDEVPKGLNQFPISEEVQQQLNRYALVFQQGGSQKPEEMKQLFGNTYWYYVHFTKLEDE